MHPIAIMCFPAACLTTCSMETSSHQLAAHAYLLLHGPAQRPNAPPKLLIPGLALGQPCASGMIAHLRPASPAPKAMPRRRFLPGSLPAAPGRAAARAASFSCLKSSAPLKGSNPRP